MTNDFPGSNSFTFLVDETDRVIRYADTWIECTEITDEEDATAAADFVRLLTQHLKALEEARKAEVKPLDEARAAIQARYKPLVERCSIAKEKVASLEKAYLHRKEEESRKTAEEAAALAAHLADEARAVLAQARTVEDVAVARAKQEAAAAAIEDARVAALTRARIGSNAGDQRARTLRKTPARVRIVNLRDAAGWAYRHRKDELAEEVEKILTRAVRAGVQDIPGIEIYREEVVA